MIKKIVINGLEINAYHGAWSFRKIDGLSEPPRRTTAITYADRNGGFVPKQLYGARVITIEGSLDTRQCDDHILERQRLYSAVPLDKYVPVRFYLSDGRIMKVEAKFETPEMPIEAGRYTDWQLTALASSHLIIDAGTEGQGSDDNEYLNKVILRQRATGGWKELVELGRDRSNRGIIEYAYQADVNAVNTGGYVASPVIKLKGAFNNPKIINNTTRQYIELDISTGDRDVIEINTEIGFAALNGGNINSRIVAGSAFWKLAVGDNILSIENRAGDGVAEIEWNNSYIAI